MGYYLYLQNECELLPANCELADVNGLCTQCAVGFVLFEAQNVCVLLPQYCNEVSL